MLNDDYIKYVTPYIQKLGYIKHPYVGNNGMYLRMEKDGFINIFLDQHINREVIHFQKCFNNDHDYKKVINEYFYNVDDLITFVTKFHIKINRLQKIKKLNERGR